MSRSLSPALIAHFRAQLPDRKLLRAKLHKLLAARWVNDEEAE